MFNWVLNSPIVSTIKWRILYIQKIGPLEKADPVTNSLHWLKTPLLEIRDC